MEMEQTKHERIKTQLRVNDCINGEMIARGLDYRNKFLKRRYIALNSSRVKNLLYSGQNK